MIESLVQAERLLVMGMLDEAEALYRRSAQTDPLNAIALVGLARVALERGDERLAYQQACQALAIDPEDAMALRMEARLSEVLATRGEPVERPAYVQRANDRSAAVPATPPRALPPDDPGARAQRAVAARNPSMAEHAARTEAANEPAELAPPEIPPAAQERRPGLLRRILRR